MMSLDPSASLPHQKSYFKPYGEGAGREEERHQLEAMLILGKIQNNAEYQILVLKTGDTFSRFLKFIESVCNFGDYFRWTALGSVCTNSALWAELV